MAPVAAVRGGLRITLPGGIRLIVRDGSDIRVQRPPGISDDLLRPFLLGSAMGAVLHQRGALPLHASAIAVAVADGCVAFVGESGAGKSTLCAALACRGFSVFSDDLCALRAADSGGWQAEAGSAYPKLHDDAVDALALDAYTVVGPRTPAGKRTVHIPAAGQFRALPLRGVYALTADAPGARPAITRLGGSEALRVIWENVYRPSMALVLGSAERTFAMAAQVASCVPVNRLARERRHETMPQVLDLLESSWATLSVRQES